ncbi:Coenzyme F420 hydrogenase/dehydrogenase, beta subunit C-terminal domain [Phytoactinopolyspora halophila]|nr:Coenzyme F420 hydrogenase/dehydrogenase, beta subunit C-terminal domain [Phytoactinopolyspora halophila]
MSRPADLRGVLENDLCIACGACVLADPSIELKLHPEKQIFEPSHPGNQAAADVCPAIEVDFTRLQDLLFPGAEQGAYGVVHSVMLAQSTDGDRNHQASSGGMIKELLIELLSRDDVDGAIVLKHVEGLNFAPGLITDVAEVDQLPGSIYHNLPKHRVLELLRENEGRYVVAAIPCELEGIYNYIFTHEPHLRGRIHTTIGLLCGWQYNWHSIRAICEFKGIDPDRIVDVSYRGGGPIGKLRIWTDDGREHATSRRLDFGYQVAFDRSFNTRRCHLCINHANFLADIVVGDAWLASTLSTKAGISLVINRRPESDELVRDLADSDRVVFTEVTVNEIRESQKPRIAFGNFAYAYADYLDERGLHRPVMDGPNRPAAQLASRSEVEEFHHELERKLELQRARRYRYLFWRKATKELGRYFSRYWDWFTHRVLRAGRDPSADRAATRETTAMFR